MALCFLNEKFCRHLSKFPEISVTFMQKCDKICFIFCESEPKEQIPSIGLISSTDLLFILILFLF